MLLRNMPIINLFDLYIASGYVLTAASCVWDVNSNEAVEPSNITLWVAGGTIPVAFFNISDCE